MALALAAMNALNSIAAVVMLVCMPPKRSDQLQSSATQPSDQQSSDDESASTLPMPWLTQDNAQGLLDDILSGAASRPDIPAVPHPPQPDVGALSFDHSIHRHKRPRGEYALGLCTSVHRVAHERPLATALQSIARRRQLGKEWLGQRDA